MDSPQPNSNNNSNNNNNIAISSSSSSSVSPTVKESPFFSYLRNLSPIKSANASKYVQRFSQTNNYHHVPPPPVFTSPRMDQHREPTFIKREETDSEGYVHLNHESLIHCFQKEDHDHDHDHDQDQDTSCSPAACCIDDYLTDPPLDVEPLTTNPNPNPSHLPHYNYMPLQSDDHVNSNLFLHPFSGAQQHVPQDANDRQDDKVADSYRSFPQPLQIVRAYKDPLQSSRPALRGSVKEADQQQRGIRRHLQFGVAMSCKDTSNETNDIANASLPDCFANFESLVPSSGQAGGNVTFLSSFCLSQSVRSAQYGDDIPASIPSGLGFPSSGITRSMCVGDLIASKQLAGNLHEQASDRNHNSAKDLLVYACVHDDQELSETAGRVDSATYPMNTMPRSCDFICVTPSEQQVVPYEGRTLTSSNTDMVGELNQVSPKKNRKRAKHSNDIEGCKRCNCKRSKCLKLYCECFAAGVYCLESCACEDCYNRPEYEDTVLDIRQQIEARNPLAFAPKVVKQATNSPANVVEEGNWTTPSSARHKRGCNCKKSKCLKKYCECYQSGVGCSSGCRCEGCKNSYGKKPVSIYTRAEKWENSTHEQLDTSEIQDDFIKAGRAHQFTSTWEEFADTTPVSHRHSGSLATSRSLNIEDSSKVSQAQAHQGSNMLSLAGYHHHSPSPKLLYGSKAMPELSPDSLLCNMLKENDTPQMLNRTSTPTKMVKAGSPNQKRVSPPQIRSQELRSSSSRGLRSVRKFNLPDMPSFPPLTPYSKSKDGVQQIDGD